MPARMIIAMLLAPSLFTTYTLDMSWEEYNDAALGGACRSDPGYSAVTRCHGRPDCFPSIDPIFS